MEPETENPTGSPPPAPPQPTEPGSARGPAIPRWVFAALVAALAAALFWPSSGRISFVRRPDPVDQTGARVPLERRFGRVTLLHFWATWCPPCVTEIPALKRLAHDLPNGSGISYALVAVEDDPTKAREFLGEIADLSLFDSDWKVARSYGTDKLPETYLLVDGKVVEKFVGATDWDDPALRARLRSLTASTPAR